MIASNKTPATKTQVRQAFVRTTEIRKQASQDTLNLDQNDFLGPWSPMRVHVASWELSVTSDLVCLPGCDIKSKHNCKRQQSNIILMICEQCLGYM